MSCRYGHCPECNSSEFDDLDIENNGKEIYVHRNCYQCGTTWTACYEFVGNKNVDKQEE